MSHTNKLGKAKAPMNWACEKRRVSEKGRAKCVGYFLLRPLSRISGFSGVRDFFCNT